MNLDNWCIPFLDFSDSVMIQIL